MKSFLIFNTLKLKHFHQPKEFQAANTIKQLKIARMFKKIEIFIISTCKANLLKNLITYIALYANLVNLDFERANCHNQNQKSKHINQKYIQK